MEVLEWGKCLIMIFNLSLFFLVAFFCVAVETDCFTEERLHEQVAFKIGIFK